MTKQRFERALRYGIVLIVFVSLLRVSYRFGKEIAGDYSHSKEVRKLEIEKIKLEIEIKKQQLAKGNY